MQIRQTHCVSEVIIVNAERQRRLHAQKELTWINLAARVSTFCDLPSTPATYGKGRNGLLLKPLFLDTVRFQT